MLQESILLLYVSAASARGELGKSAPFPSTSCLTSEIAPGDLESVPPDNMSDVSVPSMSALTVQSGPAVSAEGINLGPIKEGSSADSFLLPEDLVHLTRRSLFLIIDSDNSTAFNKLQVRHGHSTAQHSTGHRTGQARALSCWPQRKHLESFVLSRGSSLAAGCGRGWVGWSGVGWGTLPASSRGCMD